jgi:stage V sporulation protein B
MTAPALGAALVGLTGNLLFQYLKDSGCKILVSGGITLLYGVVLYIGALQAQGISLRNVFHLRADQQRK